METKALRGQLLEALPIPQLSNVIIYQFINNVLFVP